MQVLTPYVTTLVPLMFSMVADKDQDVQTLAKYMLLTLAQVLVRANLSAVVA